MAGPVKFLSTWCLLALVADLACRGVILSNASKYCQAGYALAASQMDYPTYTHKCVEDEAFSCICIIFLVVWYRYGLCSLILLIDSGEAQEQLVASGGTVQNHFEMSAGQSSPSRPGKKNFKTSKEGGGGGGGEGGGEDEEDYAKIPAAAIKAVFAGDVEALRNKWLKHHKGLMIGVTDRWVSYLGV
jgi:hypothetical protein